MHVIFVSLVLLSYLLTLLQHWLIYGQVLSLFYKSLKGTPKHILLFHLKVCKIYIIKVDVKAIAPLIPTILEAKKTLSTTKTKHNISLILNIKGIRRTKSNKLMKICSFVY